MRYAVSRLRRTRFAPYLEMLAILFLPRLSAWVKRMVARHRAEAILTVIHGEIWVAAAAVAHRLNIPLHLIVHDDLAGTMIGRHLWPGLYERAFRSAYRQAASRLCVSQCMAEMYEREIGVPGKCLLPTRGEDSPKAFVRVRDDSSPGPVVAFLGSFPYLSYVDLVRRLGDCAARLGGRLDVYSRMAEADFNACGLRQPHNALYNIPNLGAVVERIVRTAHVLLLPASFEPQDRRVMEMLFPSKLVDYTAIGLPILVWGPEYSSAVQWARANPRAAVVINDPEGSGISETLARIASEPHWACAMAEEAVRCGERDFSLYNARSILYNALSSQ